MGLLDDAIREHLDLKRRRGADPTEIERAEREALGPVRREPSMSAALAEEQPPRATVTDASPDEFVFVSEVEEPAVEQPTTVAAPEAVASAEDEAREGIAAPHYVEPKFDELAATEPPAATAPELEPAAPVGLEAEPLFEPLPESEPKPKRRHLFGRHRHEDEERPPLPAELPDDDPFIDSPAEAEPVQTGDGETVGRAQPIEREQPPALRITPETEPGNTVEYDVEQAFLEEDTTATPEDEDILEETPDFLADTPDHDRLWFEQKPPPDFDFDD